MAGEVTLDCQVGRERMTVTGSSQLAYVLVEAHPVATGTQTRMPLNFALVLDHSGSMKGAKLRAVKDAVKLVIDHMLPTDIVSVVIFDDNVHVVVQSWAPTTTATCPACARCSRPPATTRTCWRSRSSSW